ncbi:MAG: excinuclease ABC subunit UvrA, partial [bacterium]|nr:excinuclease ABC subunit UvrA [bacterium]
MGPTNGRVRRERKIVIRGAREHNLKDLNLDIPRDKLIVFTGLSGSGKSSLAFDTLYGEGQRRYIESLSAYARQFMDQIDKPDVDSIEGLSPTIAIEQKTVGKNPRSTVGTVTEIYDHMRLLYARAGVPHCPSCGQEMNALTVPQMVERAMVLGTGTNLQILAPLVRGRKGVYRKELEDLEKKGYTRVRVDGRMYEIGAEIVLARHMKHNIEVVIDRLLIKPGIERRLADSIETALMMSKGLVTFQEEGGPEFLFSQEFTCVACGVTIPEMAPRIFSFNSPYGACPECTGLGTKLVVDPELVIPDRDLTLSQGAIYPWAHAGTSTPWYGSILEAVASKHGIPMDKPVKSLKKEQVDLLLHGAGTEAVMVRHRSRHHHDRVWEFQENFEGVIQNMERRYQKTESEYMRAEIERYMTSQPCLRCEGKRLKPEALSVLIGGRHIMAVTGMSVAAAWDWATGLAGANGAAPILSPRDQTIASQILKEIQGRLKFLLDIGLEYITLDRTAGT